MAVSLYQSALIAQNNGEFKKAGILSTFAEVPLLGAMPLVSIQGNSFAWTREANLGNVQFRGVNGSYTEGAGSVETRSVPLKIIGGDLDIDRYLVQTHGPEVRSAHETMKAKLLAQTIAYQVIKGSVTAAGGATADVNGFDGLQVRFGGGFGGVAVVDAGENADQIMSNGAAALSMRNLDDAIQSVDNPTHLLMSKKMKVNITALLRSSASLATSRDEFGRIVTTYAGLPIIEADVLGTSTGLQSLGFNEGASSNTTSIYALSMTDMGLCMVQNGGIDVRDLGEQNSKPVFRTRVEWYCNLVDLHPRCVARLHNITDAAAVA